ncbi:hypothetical protein E2542_SST13352 [Spatholobus suberectus]|nr:hypothetical protein E2542_SST13352 [Spatholobus suberectus]
MLLSFVSQSTFHYFPNIRTNTSRILIYCVSSSRFYYASAARDPVLPGVVGTLAGFLHRVSNAPHWVTKFHDVIKPPPIFALPPMPEVAPPAFTLESETFFVLLRVSCCTLLPPNTF